MKVVAYMRVSTDGQTGEDKFGLDAQRETIIKFCESKDYEIVEWYIDTISGAKEYRPEFDRLLSEVGDIASAVVVAKNDRIARDVYIYFAYKNELRKKNVEVISVAEDFGALGSYAVILDAMLAAIAEVERRNINSRTSGGRTQKAKQGGYSGGRVPYGYSASNHQLIVNEDEAKLVRGIYELRGKGVTMKSIAEMINAKGYRTRKGGEFSIANIQSILSNENTYKGMYKYGNSDWVLGEHQAILEVTQ